MELLAPECQKIGRRHVVVSWFEDGGISACSEEDKLKAIFELCDIFFDTGSLGTGGFPPPSKIQSWWHDTPSGSDP
jgi:hypothetical protein